MVAILPNVFIGLIKLLPNIEFLKRVFELCLHVSYPHDIAEVLGFVTVYSVSDFFPQDVAVLVPYVVHHKLF